MAGPTASSSRDIDSPLLRARGAWVRVSELRALRLARRRSDYFSKTVSDVLADAALRTEALSANGVPFVDGRAFLAALIDNGRRPRPKSQEWTSATSAFVAALGTIHPIPDDLPLPQKRDEDAVALPPELLDVLIDAEVIVRETLERQVRVDVRHVLVAFLRAEIGRRAVAEIGLAPPGPDFMAAIAPLLHSHVASQLMATERGEAWAALFSDLAGMPIPAPPTPDTVVHPSFDADAVKPWLDTSGRLVDDPLGVARDARAMADLVCLQEAEPPLAIGLFGDWGAGKSTFMEMLEHAVGELTERARAAREAGRPLPFVERVAHIRFNAWHYMESELWASIATHIFRSLYEDSRRGQPRDWLSEAKLDRLIERLEVVRAAEADAGGQLQALDGAIDSVREHLNGIETRRLEAEKRLIRTQIADVLTQIPVKDESGRVADAMQALGLGSHVENARQLDDTVAEAQTLAGRIKLLVTTLTGAPRRSVPYALFGLACFVIVTGGIAWGASALADMQPALSRAGGEIAAFLGLVTGTAAWLLPHLKHINRHLGPLLDAHAAAMAQRTEREQTLRVEEAAARRELDELGSRKARAEAELQEKAAERGRLQALARGERPGELLARFIEDRADADDYRRHLGVIALVRQDFERMSAIMAQRRTATRADDDLPTIDRIVLYVDDLDRCRDEQVVKVLEAVHLLLAFPLFVVVVGVDARWLEGALQRFYSQQLGGIGQASPLDYLEKIFQVPFWLRPLVPGDGGTYERLIGTLVRSHIEADADSAPVMEGPAEEAADENAAPTELTRLDVTPQQETVEQTLQRMTLTAAEIALMNALGPLAGKSPRAVKRFVNIYRLIRARKTGSALDAYLGRGDGPALYPAMMLALAMETGLQAEKTAFLETLLQLIDDENAPAGRQDDGAEPFRDDFGEVVKALQEAAPTGVNRIAEGIRLRIWLVRNVADYGQEGQEAALRYLGDGDFPFTVRRDVASVCRRMTGQLAAFYSQVGQDYPLTEALLQLRREGDLSRYVFRR